MFSSDQQSVLSQTLFLNGKRLSGKAAFSEALASENDPQIRSVLQFAENWCSDDPCLTVHTSGSTGTPKPILVKKSAMAASAAMTEKKLCLKKGDTALLCLPMDYIAGHMMAVRAICAGLHLVTVNPNRNPLRNLEESPVFAALVPLQVRATLEEPSEREKLRGVRELIIGGAAVEADLAGQLRDFPNRVWSTYGMTETLSHIALRPLSGPRAGSWYEPLEGVSVSLSPRGTLAISAPAVNVSLIETNDLVVFEKNGNRFRVLGRADNVIDSGGIKVPAEMLEELLQPHMAVPFAVTGIPDPVLGSAVTLMTAGETVLPDVKRLLAEKGLSPYWKPRFLYEADSIPQTRTGKPDRSAIREKAAAAAKTGLLRRIF